MPWFFRGGGGEDEHVGARTGIPLLEVGAKEYPAVAVGTARVAQNNSVAAGGEKLEFVPDRWIAQSPHGVGAAVDFDEEWFEEATFQERRVQEPVFDLSAVGLGRGLGVFIW